MKLILKSACVAFVLTVLLSMVPFEARCQNISDEVFRLHILANSDSEADQELKLKVRDAVLEYSEEMFLNAESKTDAIAVTKARLDEIAEVAQKEIYSLGYSYPVRAEVTKTYFDTRYYGEVTMPSGFYDALRIEIGSGKGKNWWCVMYPSLCVGSAANADSLKKELNDDEMKIVTDEKFHFKFKLLELFEAFKNRFLE